MGKQVRLESLTYVKVRCSANSKSDGDDDEILTLDVIRNDNTETPEGSETGQDRMSFL